MSRKNGGERDSPASDLESLSMEVVSGLLHTVSSPALRDHFSRYFQRRRAAEGLNLETHHPRSTRDVSAGASGEEAARPRQSGAGV